MPVAGAALGAVGGGISSYFEQTAARKSRNKSIDAQNKATAAQTALGAKSLSLEERMVKLNEDAAFQAAAASQAQPSSGIGDYLPWILLAGVGGWMLMKKR